ncbi:MAG TPA: adenylyl-sulfate kinase [Chitinophagaceae bacterium]|nr:adenylyl-sulfate kinase [Chitinophagaceae bacterium]
MLLIQLTGLSGAGKTTIAKMAKGSLEKLGYNVELLDGDEYRKHLCKDLGFTRNDRIENIRRMGTVGLLLARHGIISIMAAINPYEEARKALKDSGASVKTVFIDCPVDIAQKRDTKGLYRRAYLPEDHPEHLTHFTGVSDPFEIPVDPDLVIKTDRESPEQSSERLADFIVKSIQKM